jgi:hypothetical protein
MPDDTPSPPATPSTPSAAPAPSPPEGLPLPHLGEEFGTAKRNLPPTNIVAAVLAVAAVMVGIFAFVLRAKPQGGGLIDNIAAVEIPNQNAVLVAVNVTVHNAGRKPLWIRTIKATLKTDTSELSDEAASAVDFDRYFQAFPALKEHALEALTPETKLQPGNEARGTVVVSFPVTQDAFDKRKSLSVVIQPYDQPLPLVLTK